MRDTDLQMGRERERKRERDVINDKKQRSSQNEKKEKKNDSKVFCSVGQWLILPQTYYNEICEALLDKEILTQVVRQGNKENDRRVVSYFPTRLTRMPANKF